MTLTRTMLAAAALTMAISIPVYAADAMSKDQMKAEKERIASEYKAGKDKCKEMKGNEKDICMAEAKGTEKVAKAELAAKEKDTPKAHYNVAVAKADMEYHVAKEKCDDMKGKDKSACNKDAKSAHDSAKKQARADNKG